LIRRCVEDVRRDAHAGDNGTRLATDARADRPSAMATIKVVGICQVSPNHALIILAPAVRQKQLQETMHIGEHRGLGHDAMLATVGCLFGIKN